MKMLMKPALALMLALGLSSGALAAEYTKGEVKKIDETQKKLTIKHEELKNLEMPAMTMVFVAGDVAMLGKVKVGQKIEFVAERVNGKLTVTEIK